MRLPQSLCAVLIGLSFALGASSLGVQPLAWAAEKPKDKAVIGNNLDLAIVGVPIIFHGKLVNYVMVRLRLKLAPGVDPQRLQDKEPYFREALVKLGYKSPLYPPKDLTRVDEPLLITKMLAACTSIAGPGVVTAIEVESQQPQTRAGLPDTADKPATPTPRVSGYY